MVRAKRSDCGFAQPVCPRQSVADLLYRRHAAHQVLVVFSLLPVRRFGVGSDAGVVVDETRTADHRDPVHLQALHPRRHQCHRDSLVAPVPNCHPDVHLQGPPVAAVALASSYPVGVLAGLDILSAGGGVYFVFGHPVSSSGALHRGESGDPDERRGGRIQDGDSRRTQGAARPDRPLRADRGRLGTAAKRTCGDFVSRSTRVVVSLCA